MNNKKILIVDDEARMRKLLKDFLSASNFEILEAENGQVALDTFKGNEDIALIILDVMMPVLDGWATLSEIRKISKVPVIMLTARGEEHDELFGFELGVDEYISKPFSPKILVARVEALLNRCYPDKDNNIEYDGIIIDKSAHIVTVDGIDKFKAQSRKEANDMIENIEFSEDAIVYYICETEKRTIRKMVDIVIAA